MPLRRPLLLLLCATAAAPLPCALPPDHYVVDGSFIVPPRTAIPMLRLFLGGTGTTPSDYSCLLRSAAADGSAVIGLNYRGCPLSDAQRNAACAEEFAAGVTASVAACVGESHASALWGGGGDGVCGRGLDGAVPLLVTMLMDHAGDWGQRHMWSGHVEWATVVAVGHSQGGGHVAYLAHHRPLGAALLISAPQDGCGPGEHCAQTMPWLDGLGKTTRLRSLHHAYVRALRLLLPTHSPPRYEDAQTLIAANLRDMTGWVASLDDVWVAPGDKVATNDWDFREARFDMHAHSISRHPPPDMDQCGGRAYHCSVARDSATPQTVVANATAAADEKVHALYDELWQQLMWGFRQKGSDATAAAMW